MFCWIHKELGFKHLKAYAQPRLIMCLCVIPGQQNTGTAVCISRYITAKHIYTGQDRYQIQLQV